MSKRGGLGRGLSALIPGAPEVGEAAGLLEVPVNAVAPNPKQPRTRFDDETIDALAASIREVGILQPIVVRRAGAGYELVAGERRLRAAKVAGLATVPVVLRDTDDADLLREALDREHPSGGPRTDRARRGVPPAPRGARPQAGGARRPGRCLAFSHREHDPPAAASARRAAAAGRRADPGRPRSRPALPRRRGGPERPGAAGLRRGPLGSRDGGAGPTLRGRAARRPGEAPSAKRSPSPADVGLAEVEEILSEQLATRVQIQMGKKRGRVMIEFGSADDLERIVSEIIGSGPGPGPGLGRAG